MVQNLCNNADNMSVELSDGLQTILVNSAIKVFPMSNKKKYVEKSNKAEADWYDKECWMSR